MVENIRSMIPHREAPQPVLYEVNQGNRFKFSLDLQDKKPIKTTNSTNGKYVKVSENTISAFGYF
ncbi:MAG: hypothetical protein KC496_06980, partial [Anaerolineae bacterium]|nr:hypothetical protein [Anaerolineae bacterium]